MRDWAAWLPMVPVMSAVVMAMVPPVVLPVLLLSTLRAQLVHDTQQGIIKHVIMRHVYIEPKRFSSYL